MPASHRMLWQLVDLCPQLVDVDIGDLGLKLEEVHFRYETEDMMSKLSRTHIPPVVQCSRDLAVA